jgi:hypothetical protein
MTTELPKPLPRWSPTRLVFWMVLVVALTIGVVSWFRFHDRVVPVLAEER